MKNQARSLPLRPKRQKMTGMEKKEALVGYVFITPYLILFIIFTGIPFITAFLMSFVNLKFISNLENLRFVGLDNFVRMFQTPEIMASLGRTFLYSLLYVPLIMVTGFIFAYLLNKGVFLKRGLRAMIFLPYVSNLMAVAVVFTILLGLRGPFMPILNFLGSNRPLLLDPRLALATVVVIAVWKGIGLNMLVYLGALQGVSQELLEAADMDGASTRQKIWNIVIPSISPTTFFLLISSLITSMQNYTMIQAFTEGGPGQATMVMSVSIIRRAFVQFETSFASAMAIVMFAIVMLFTLIQWYGQKKWVNY